MDDHESTVYLLSKPTREHLSTTTHHTPHPSSLRPANPVNQFEPAHLPVPHSLQPLQNPLQPFPSEVDFLRMRDQFSFGEQLARNFPEVRAKAVDLGHGFDMLAEHSVRVAYAGVGVDELMRRGDWLAGSKDKSLDVFGETTDTIPRS